MSRTPITKRLRIRSCLLMFLSLSITLSAQDAAQGARSTGAANASYTFKTVDYPNDSYTQLLGVNDSGEIAGYHGSGLSGHPSKGFKLRLPNNFTLEDFPGSAQTRVTGINDLGQTVGYYLDTAGVQHGFLKLGASFKTVDYPAQTLGLSGNQLFGLNASSQLVGSYQDGNGNFYGYIYERFGGVFLVLTIPNAINPVAIFVQATGINKAGQVSGVYIDKAGAQHGFLLSQGHFRTLDFPGGAATSALGLNNVGQVVGSYSPDAFSIHGFVWTDGKGFQTVDDPDGVGSTIVNSISDKGVIVGSYGHVCSAGSVCHGFVGTP